MTRDSQLVTRKGEESGDRRLEEQVRGRREALPKAQEPVSFAAVAEGQGKHTCRSLFPALCDRPVAGGETNAFRRVAFRERPPFGQDQILPPVVRQNVNPFRLPFTVLPFTPFSFAFSFHVSRLSPCISPSPQFLPDPLHGIIDFFPLPTKDHRRRRY